TLYMIFACPRCRPSKFPSASTGLGQRGGGSAGKWANTPVNAKWQRPNAKAIPSSACDRWNVPHQPIVGQRHPVGKTRVRGLVSQIVAHMREPRLPGADPPGRVDRFLQREVR